MTTATPDADTVVAPDDISDIPAHFVCHICFPDREVGRNMGPVTAICGAKIAGISAPDDATMHDWCESNWLQHWLRHQHR